MTDDRRDVAAATTAERREADRDGTPSAWRDYLAKLLPPLLGHGPTAETLGPG